MDKREHVISNFLWRFCERFGSQLVTLVVSFLLARMLDVEVYGLTSKVAVITAVLLVFVDSGMGNALIQKKDPDDLDFSSVFYFNVCFCLLLYAALFFASPAISRMYREPELTPILRVLGLTVVVSGVKNVQQAYVSKTMQFKRFFFASLGGTLPSAALGIFMARRGFGVWALVAQQLSNVTLNTAILWLTVDWRPIRAFSLERLKGLLSFGWKLLAASLLDTIYLKIYPLIIGIRYTNADLAFYERGNYIPSLITENINSSIDSVLLPVLSEQQDRKDQVREIARRAIKTSSYIMMPLMAGLAVCAEPLVRFLLTDKWLPCVPFLQVFCVVYAFYPMHTANLNAIKAMGRSDVFLRLEIIKKLLEAAVLVFSMRFGVFAMALGLLSSDLISLGINAWPNRRLLDYSLGRQLRDLFPALALSLLMAGCVWPVSLLHLPDALTLLIQVPLGAGIYILLSKLLHVESFDYVLSAAKNLLHKGQF